MRHILLRQAVVLPLAGMLLPMLVGFLVPGYSSIHQHMSELELLSPSVSLACRVGAIIAGASIIGFSIAIVLEKTHRLSFTAVAALVFGLSMISNGVFTMGSPLHGLYAIGLSIILVPAFFAAENGRGMNRLSLVTAAIVLIYMWALMTGIEPAATRGLTQRLATLVMFGWFGYTSWMLLAQDRLHSTRKAA